MYSEDENWLSSRWRPIMAMVYAMIDFFDFIVAPVLWGLLVYVLDGDVIQWKPLTLDNGGMFHVAMGAVLGITAWTRGQEKIERIAAEPVAETQKQNREAKG